jgi:hypothetical protein
MCSRRRRLRLADAGVQFDVFFRAAGAVAASGIFVAEAGKFVAVANAIAVAGGGCGFYRD